MAVTPRLTAWPNSSVVTSGDRWVCGLWPDDLSAVRPLKGVLNLAAGYRGTCTSAEEGSESRTTAHGRTPLNAKETAQSGSRKWLTTLLRLRMTPEGSIEAASDD